MEGCTTAEGVISNRYKLKEKNVLVLDLLNIGSDEINTTFEACVITTDTDGLIGAAARTEDSVHLAAIPWDNSVIDYLIKLIGKKYGKDVRGDSKALQKFLPEVYRAKRELKNDPTQVVTVEIKSLFEGVDLLEPISKAMLDEMNLELLNKIRGVIKKVLKDSNLKRADIDYIMLVDGYSKVPQVPDLLMEELFQGKEFFHINMAGFLSSDQFF